MAEVKQNNTFTKDAALQFLESAATSLGVGSATTSVHDALDLNGNGLFEGYLVIDISAIDTTTGDEVYSILVQLSDSSDFTNIYHKVTIPCGSDAATIHTGTTNTAAATRISLPITNEYGGVGYQYMRLVTIGAGTSPSITYTAFLAAR